MNVFFAHDAMSPTEQTGSDDSQSPPVRSYKQLALIVLLFITVFALHCWQCLRYFPSLRAIVDQQPIIQVDHSLHLYHGSLGSQFLWEHGTNWGYDPYFMAGYPKTPFHDPSAGLADLSLFLAGGGYRPDAYKIGLLVTMVTFPLLILAATWCLCRNLVAACAAMVLALWYYWTGFANVLLMTGLYSFLWSTGWLIATCAAVVCWHRCPSILSWVSMVLVTAFALFAHPTVSLVLAGPMVCFYLTVAWLHGWRWHLGLALAVVIVVLSNSFWLLPFWNLWPLRKPGYVFMATDPSDWTFFLHFYRNHPLPLFLLLSGLAGLIRWICRRQWDILASVGILWLELALLTHVGSCLSWTRALEPLRFQVPLHLLAAVPAADAWLALCRSGWCRRWTGRLLCTAVVLAIFGWLAVQGALHETYYRLRYPRVFAIGLQQPMVELCQWIKQNTDPNKRILLEDQLRLLEATVPESLHWTCLLPLYTDGRQYVGGQYQQVPLHHHVASLGDFHLAGQPIERFTPEELRQYLLRYNIGTVICWSPRTRAVFARLPFLEPVATLPRFTSKPTENRYFIFSVKLESSFFQTGSGTLVRAEPNRIEFRDLVPEDGRIIFRFHWLESFATEPPLELEPVPVPGDRIGFVGVRVDQPLPRLVIYNTYRNVRHELLP